jgi:hypothetical protein
MKLFTALRFSIPLLLLAMLSFSPAGNIFVSQNGNVKFTSKAPLETIAAESKLLSGALDVERRTFAFILPVSSFDGFNSPLQKEHFNENYLETDEIPQALFKGKIIEEVNLAMPGTYMVRAKGIMSIHGVEKEMIIKPKIVSSGGQIQVDAEFTVLLSDFKILIPKLVNQKIAEEIKVNVKLDMSPKK